MKNIDYNALQFLSEAIVTDMKILTTKEDLGYNITKVDNIVQNRDIRFKTEIDQPFNNFYRTPIYTNDEITGLDQGMHIQPSYYVEYNNKIHFFCENETTKTPNIYFHKIFDGKKLYDGNILPIIFNLRYGGGSSYCKTNHSAVVCVYNNNIHIIGKTKDTDDSSDSSWDYHFYGDGENEWQLASSFPESLYGKYINGIVYNGRIHVFVGIETNITTDLTMRHYSWNGSTWTKHSDLPFTFYNAYNSINLRIFDDKIIFPVVCNTNNEICFYTLDTNNNYQKKFIYSSSNIAITTSNIMYITTEVYKDKVYINNLSLDQEGFWNGTEFYLENRHVLNSINTTLNSLVSSHYRVFSFIYKDQLYIMNRLGNYWLTFIYKCGHHIDATRIFYLEE